MSKDKVFNQKKKAVSSSTSHDPRLVALVRIIARSAAERDYKKLLMCGTTLSQEGKKGL